MRPSIPPARWGCPGLWSIRGRNRSCWSQSGYCTTAALLRRHVGRPGRRGRNAPKFPVAMWNVRSRTNEGIPRTTNSLEGWHCALHTMVDNPHPSMWRFLAALQREQQLQHAALMNLRSGHPAPLPKKKYVDRNRRLKSLIAKNDRGELTTRALVWHDTTHSATPPPRQGAGGPALPACSVREWWPRPPRRCVLHFTNVK